MKTLLLGLLFLFNASLNSAKAQCIVSVFPTPQLLGCVESNSPVRWTDAVGVNITNNNIDRISGNNWNSGAASIDSVYDNMFVSTIIAETNRTRAIGLSINNANNHFNTIDFAFQLRNNGTLRIYESGSYRGNFGNYATNDTLKIAAENDTIKYYKNNVLLYTSALNPSFPLIVDASIFNNNGTLQNVNIGTYVQSTFECKTKNMGSSVNYQWQLNGFNVGINSNIYTNSTLSNLDVVTCIVTPLGAFCGGNSVVSNMLNLTTATPNLGSATVLPTFASTGCKKAVLPVMWENKELVLANGNTLTKSGATGWNAGATSIIGLNNNMAMTTIVNETNTYRMVGLTHNSVNANYNTIDYCFYLAAGGDIYIYESGNYQANVGYYNSGDELKIAVEANSIVYYINNTVVYTSTAGPTLPLYVDCSIFSNGGTIQSVNIEGYIQDTFQCSTVDLGLNPTYQWVLNGQPVGSNSNLYTNANLVDGDELYCNVTPIIGNCNNVHVQSNQIEIEQIFSNDFSAFVNAVPVTSSCLKAETMVEWIDVVNIAVNGNSIERVSGSNWGGSGAASANFVDDNMYFYTIANETNTYRMVGLSSVNTNANWNTIDFGMYLFAGGGITVYESGTYVGYFSNFSTGDTLKIGVENGVVKYYNNSVNFYTSTVTPSLPLVVDASIYSAGGTIQNAVIGGLTQGVFSCNATNVGSNPTYQWFFNGAAVGGNTNTYNNYAVGLNDSVWCTVTPSVTNCNNTVLTTKKVVISGLSNQLTTWTGGTNSAWTETSNWSQGIPNQNMSARIPTGLINYPVISAASYCQNLIIEPGASVDLISNDTLFVFGSWQNEGVFNNNIGTISLSPGCNTETGFYNLNQLTTYGLMIDNGATVNLFGSKVSIRGTLALENGSLVTNDSLRMVSDATETARISEIKNGSISGHVEVERYIDAGATNWRFLTFSVAGQDLESFDDDFITSGFTGTDFPNFPNPSNPFSSFYKYSESNGVNFVDGYQVPNSTAEPVQMGQGWWIWCGDSLQGTNPFTIDAVGPIYQGDLNLPVSYTPTSGNLNEDGWNMIANPYHCTIDWDASDWVKTNVDGAIFIWNPDLAQYASYVGGVGTNLGNNKIASSQAFWVHTNGPAPQLTIKESCKIDQDHGFIKKAAQQLSLLRLELNSATSILSDETVLRFDNNATTNFDTDYDALKFYSSDFASLQLASSLQGKDYTINAIPVDSVVSIDLKVVVPTNDSCTISVTKLTNSTELACMVIEDLQTGEISDLKTDSSITFYQTAYTYSARLRIHITRKPTVETTNVSCFDLSDGMLEVSNPSSVFQNQSWLNSNGDTISNSLNASNLIADTYFLTYSNDFPACQALIDSFVVAQPAQLTANSVVSNSSCENCCDGKIDLTVFGGTTPYQVLWDHPIISSDLSVSNLCEGEYRVAVRDHVGCETTASFHISTVLSNGVYFDEIVNLYPNPTSGLISIDGADVSPKDLHFYNTLGQNVSSLITTETINSNKIVVNLANLPTGIYYINIKNRTFSVSKL